MAQSDVSDLTFEEQRRLDLVHEWSATYRRWCSLAIAVEFYLNEVGGDSDLERWIDYMQQECPEPLIDREWWTSDAVD